MATSSSSPLEESTAAAVGALGATLALYPLDVAKTRIQAEAGSAAAPARGALATCVSIARREGAAQLLVGVGPKAACTVVSNFAFAYFFETLKRLHARLGLTAGVASSLCLGSLAGALNICATLPAETVTTRLQVGGRRVPETCCSACRHILAEGGLAGCAHARAARLAQLPCPSREPSARPRARGRFWRGFAASLVLVANPAINVTVFDALKARLLAALGRLRGRPARSLSVAQAFALGCVAKAVATLVTYPLIRVKVMQQSAKQAQPQPAGARPSQSRAGHTGGGDGNAPAAGGAGAKSAAALLREIWAAEGVGGLYLGCSAQLLTTVLKAGLLLMGKEKALALARALLRRRAHRARALLH